jgi:hypothetical protein
MTRLDIYCKALGWQGGTIHQVAQATETPVNRLVNLPIIYGHSNGMECLGVKPSLDQSKRIQECLRAGGDNRFFVFEDTILRAAQTTLKGALQYMRPGCVLLVK